MFWQWWRKATQLTHQASDEDIIYPEVKGTVTRESIEEALRDSDDALIKELTSNGEKVVLVYLRSMVKKEILQETVFDPLDRRGDQHPLAVLRLAEPVADDQLPKVLHMITSGRTILLFMERNLILSVDTFSTNQRNVTAPESESTVLGPQDGFTESLDTNLGLIRMRIHSPHLKVKQLFMGTETRNSLVVVYMENLANPENVQRVIQRLKNIEFSGNYGLAVIQQMIEDKPYSPFPQFGLTTRPDNAVAALLDARILIMAEGSPEVSICPATFFEMFASPEDYYNRWWTASLLRFVRFGGLFVTTLLTSAYVAVLTYHPEMLPPQLLTILAESRGKVPFPPVIEVIIIEMVIEILREAGARMPTKIGQTIGIVGGIVIGTAVVEAGLASNIVIVLVSVTALLSFLPPNYLMSNAVRLVRYYFILAAGLLGVYGQMLVLAFLFAHLLNLTSLGSPYMTPVVPRRWTDMANSIIRAPMLFQVARMGMSRARKYLSRPLDEE
ncbi:spore germination protein [Brevibacillus humidisoli]|uniref:spore germination protein n=1 Tax=Brevibacillus humidisoli TaxID=2895522 RepID=UPI001E42FD7B|nr:spore germination protein [Brevibacillus humidisoli]UFJ38941.1 spore germination protein [Brevibacillus humidisoli]